MTAVCYSRAGGNRIIRGAIICQPTKQRNLMSRLIQIALLSVALPFTCTVMAKEITAPFGLTWGQSKTDLQNQGVTFYDCGDIDFMQACQTKSLPKPLSIAEIYILFFYPRKGLIKVGMFGKTISDDIAGSNGKADYARIKTSLTTKYGSRLTEVEIIGQKLYDGHDEFYQCLAYAGCGAWLSLWEGSDGSGILLQLQGLSRGEGYLTLTYESKEWSQIADDEKAKKSTDDDSAL